MPRVQLNLKMPAALVQELKAQAQHQGITLTALVEHRLAGSYLPASSDLADRLAAVENRLAALEVGPVRAHVAPKPASPKPVAVITHTGDGITTAALADLLGMKRGTLNARIGRAGGLQPGLVIDEYQCCEVVTPDRGGPARGIWWKT